MTHTLVFLCCLQEIFTTKSVVMLIKFWEFQKTFFIDRISKKSISLTFFIWNDHFIFGKKLLFTNTYSENPTVFLYWFFMIIDSLLYRSVRLAYVYCIAVITRLPPVRWINKLYGRFLVASIFKHMIHLGFIKLSVYIRQRPENELKIFISLLTTI